MKKAKLKVVPKQEPKPLDMAGDIYAADRAKIRSRNWASIHIAGDRRAPLDIPDRPHRRTWTSWER